MIFRAAPSLDLFPTVEDAFDRRYRHVNRRAFENPEETIGAPRNLCPVTAGIRWLIVAGLWLAGAGASPVWLGAQTASVTELKAAFVYNFLRFAEWPPDALHVHFDHRRAPAAIRVRTFGADELAQSCGRPGDLRGAGDHPPAGARWTGS